MYDYLSKEKSLMNCRGEKTRIKIVEKYIVKPVTHIRLLNGQSKRSDAEAELTDQYYIFECILKSDFNKTETIICGTGAANHFFALTNEKNPALFDPLKSENSPNESGSGLESISDHKKWNPESKLLYEAIQWLIICWDIVPRGPLIEIKRKLEKNFYKEPLISQIKAVNTIISKDSSGKTLSHMIDNFRINNTIKCYDFSLLDSKLLSQNIQSYF